MEGRGFSGASFARPGPARGLYPHDPSASQRPPPDTVTPGPGFQGGFGDPDTQATAGPLRLSGAPPGWSTVPDTRRAPPARLGKAKGSPCPPPASGDFPGGCSRAQASPVRVWGVANAPPFARLNLLLHLDLGGPPGPCLVAARCPGARPQPRKPQLFPAGPAGGPERCCSRARRPRRLPGAARTLPVRDRGSAQTGSACVRAPPEGWLSVATVLTLKPGLGAGL